MDGNIIDLGEAARRARQAADAKTGVQPAIQQKEQHPAWPLFQQVLAGDRARGHQLGQARVMDLWGGFRTGFEMCAQQFAENFQIGNFTLEGRSPGWWTELRDAAIAVVESGGRDEYGRTLDALREHLSANAVIEPTVDDVQETGQEGVAVLD